MIERIDEDGKLRRCYTPKEFVEVVNEMKMEHERYVYYVNRARNRRWLIRLLLVIGFSVWYFLFKK